MLQYKKEASDAGEQVKDMTTKGLGSNSNMNIQIFKIFFSSFGLVWPDWHWLLLEELWKIFAEAVDQKDRKDRNLNLPGYNCCQNYLVLHWHSRDHQRVHFGIGLSKVCHWTSPNHHRPQHPRGHGKHIHGQGRGLSDIIIYESQTSFDTRPSQHWPAATVTTFSRCFRTSGPGSVMKHLFKFS